MSRAIGCESRRFGLNPLFAALGLALLAVPSVSAQDEPAPQDPVPAGSGVKERLVTASRIKREANGKSGQERIEILMRAVEAYDAIARDFPQEKVSVQESLFRSAGILRALSRYEEARKRYLRSVEINASRTYSARSMLELGHIHRRQSDFKTALEWYERTAKEFAVLLPYRDDACLWAGKVLSRMGNLQRARERWEIVSAGGEGALDRIQAFDLTASSYIEEGNRDKAKEILAACDRSLAELAQSETREGRRIAKALGRMRSRTMLEKDAGEKG